MWRSYIIHRADFVLFGNLFKIYEFLAVAVLF